MPVSSIIKLAVSVPCLAPAQNPTPRMRRKSGGRNQTFTISPATSLLPRVHITHEYTCDIHNHAPRVTGSHRWKEQSHKVVKNREICRNLEPGGCLLTPTIRLCSVWCTTVFQIETSRLLLSHQLQDGPKEHPGVFEGPVWTLWEERLKRQRYVEKNQSWASYDPQAMSGDFLTCVRNGKHSSFYSEEAEISFKTDSSDTCGII